MTAEDCRAEAKTARLGFGAPQEKLDCATRPVSQFVGPVQIYSPLPYHSVEKPFHELRQINHGEIACDVTTSLPSRKNLTQQSKCCSLGFPQFRRTDRIHRACEYHRLPQRPPILGDFRQSLIEPAKPFARGRLTRKFGFKTFSLSGERTPPDLAQNSILAREISEECWLADLQNLNDVIYPRVFVTSLAK